MLVSDYDTLEYEISRRMFEARYANLVHQIVVARRWEQIARYANRRARRARRSDPEELCRTVFGGRRITSITWSDGSSQ
jgi:uncharacterized membrane-anchored protein